MRLQLGAFDIVLVDGNLLSQGEVLGDQAESGRPRPARRQRETRGLPDSSRRQIVSVRLETIAWMLES